MRDCLSCTENIKIEKNNADENFRENSETKSKSIDPFCHQLKRKLSDTSSKKLKIIMYLLNNLNITKQI